MANTMFNNKNNLMNDFLKFSDNIKKSGRQPKDILDEVMKSGKYTQSDLDRAKKMANFFAKFIK